MGTSTGQTAFQLAYQVSPIILTGGIAQNMPGGALSITSIAEAANFAFGVLAGSSGDLDQTFANFQPAPGGTLINQRIGTYPFANQSVAANAVIADPLTISLIMLAPARGDGGYFLKLAAMTALQSMFSQHNAAGGSYIIATPAYFYASCVMRQMRDVTPAVTKQVQVAWQLDFEQPLLTLASALQAQNSLMSKLTNGTQVTSPTAAGESFYSNSGTQVGTTSGLSTPSISPAAAQSSGSTIQASDTVGTALPL